LSEPVDGEDWDGEVGFITDVLKRHGIDLRKAHAYLCGPPPMVEAAMPLLAMLGTPEKHIYYDKFTTTGGED
jgi:propane monooxygenase reductase subunit